VETPMYISIFSLCRYESRSRPQPSIYPQLLECDVPKWGGVDASISLSRTMTCHLSVVIAEKIIVCLLFTPKTIVCAPTGSVLSDWPKRLLVGADYTQDNCLCPDRISILWLTEAIIGRSDYWLGLIAHKIIVYVPAGSVFSDWPKRLLVDCLFADDTQDYGLCSNRMIDDLTPNGTSIAIDVARDFFIYILMNLNGNYESCSTIWKRHFPLWSYEIKKKRKKGRIKGKGKESGKMRVRIPVQMLFQ
jgi:hypothetical protein